MGNCDLCGKEDSLIDAIVEGTMLSVCRSCLKFGEAIPVNKPVQQETRRANIVIEKDEALDFPEESLIENFSLKIKAAREAKEMKQEDLAKSLAEKESVIHRIEAGQLEPDDKLVKKLEQFFGLSLKTKVNVKRKIKSLDLKNSNLTIGDLLDIQKK